MKQSQKRPRGCGNGRRSGPVRLPAKTTKAWALRRMSLRRSSSDEPDDGNCPDSAGIESTRFSSVKHELVDHILLLAVDPAS